MSKIVKLTVADRHNILKYAYNLPSTLGTYFSFDEFASLLEFTPEEEKEFEIHIEEGEIKCNCPERTFDFDIEKVPEAIAAAIRTRVADYKDEMQKLREANKGNESYQDSPLFTAMVKYLSMLIPDEGESKERDPQFKILK